MDTTKKVTFVITSMARGGAERVVSVLSNYYTSIGWDVSIVMLWHNIVGYELDEKVKLINLSNDKIKPIVNLPIIAGKLIKYLCKEKPDVVISFIAENCIITDIACKIAGVKHISSERNDPNEVKRSRVIKYLINYFYKRCDRIIFQTERAKNYYPEKIKRKSVIIGNPIKVETIAAVEKQKKIVSVGRLALQKNHRMLIECFEEIYLLYPDYILEIYGEGKLHTELQELIDEKGLENNVFLMGSVENIHEKICDSQIFVLSSNYEGLSNALLEAMMMGIPCVSTNCAGSDEVIEDGKNGFLVPVADKNSLKNAIIKLIDNEALRNEFSKNSKVAMERFKTENIINLWKKVIEE